MSVAHERTDEILRMVRVLAEAAYRDLSPSANAIRLAVARRLSREGLDDRVLRCLLEYARVSDSQGSPSRLFAYWLDRPSRTMTKVAEMRSKNAWLQATSSRLESKASTAEAKVFDINAARRAL